MNKLLLAVLLAIMTTGAFGATCHVNKAAIAYSDLKKFAAMVLLVKEKGQTAPEVMNTLMADIATGGAMWVPEGTKVFEVMSSAIEEGKMVIISLENPYTIVLIEPGSLTCD